MTPTHLFGCLGQNGAVVVADGLMPFGEDVALGDPLERLLVGLPGVLVDVSTVSIDD